MSIGLATDGNFGGTSGAAAGPSLSVVSPVVGSTLDADEEIVLLVTADPDGGADIDTIDSISVRFIGGVAPTEIYDGAAFIAAFAGSSVNIVGDEATITLVYAGGWIVGVAEVIVESTDTGASSSTEDEGSWFFDVAAAEAAEAAGPTPIPVAITEVSEVDEQDHVEIALQRLPQQFRRLP